MRVAICDTDRVFICSLKHLLYNYANVNHLDLLVETFRSGEELLSSEHEFLLIFIEYSLSGINGLETAKEFRRRHNDVKIVFVSNYTEFVFEAFEVNAYRFLTKPLPKTVLFETLDDFFIAHYTESHVLINDGIDTFCINSNQILFLEASNKHCYIHLDNKTILYKKTMARAFENLPKSHFQKINRAFVINFNHIDKYNSDCVFLKNGKKLHITRTYFKPFEENYIEYSNCQIL